MKSLLLIVSLLAIASASPALAQQKSAKQLEDEQKKKEFYAEAAKKKLYRDDLKGFFDQYIADRYVIQNGVATKANVRSFKILQVLDDTTLLMLRGFDGNEPDIIAVRTGSTAGLTDGKHFTIAMIPDGTYQYVNVQGAKRTIEAFKHVNTMTLEEYKQQKAKGVKFSEEPRP